MSLREFITGLGSGQPESLSAAFRAMKRAPGVAALNGKVYAIGGRTMAGCVTRHTYHLARASPELQNDRRHCPFRAARIRTQAHRTRSRTNSHVHNLANRTECGAPEGEVMVAHKERPGPLCGQR
jgi:hypothetical protein